jgi:hypothetical protein
MSGIAHIKLSISQPFIQSTVEGFQQLAKGKA